MGTPSLSHLDHYVAALQACLASAQGYAERNNCFERLSAAGAMRTELVNGNIGSALTILTEEQRAIGWNGFYSQGGDSVHEAFQRLAEALTIERLAGLPDAGFGH
jgi:hypothetical protein